MHPDSVNTRMSESLDATTHMSPVPTASLNVHNERNSLEDPLTTLHVYTTFDVANAI